MSKNEIKMGAKASPRWVSLKANELLKTIKSSSGGPRMEIELNQIPAKAYKAAEEVRETMAPVTQVALEGFGEDSETAKLLEEAVLISEQINPNSIKNNFFFKHIPSKTLQKFMLRKFVVDFPSHKEQLDDVFQNLRIGKEERLRMMVVMSNRHDELVAFDEYLDTEISIVNEGGKLIEAVDTSGMEPREKDKYLLALDKVSRMERDLITIKTAVAQFFISIEEIMKSNTPLTESINSILTVGPIVMDNAMLINAELTKRAQVIKAAQSATTMIGGALKENARNVKQGAIDIQKLHENPAIALDDFEESFNDLREAVEIGRETMANSTRKSKEMSASLRNMTVDFQRAVDDFNNPIAIKEG